MGRRAMIVMLVVGVIAAVVNFPVAIMCGKSRTQQAGVPVVINMFAAGAGARGWPARTPHAQAWPAMTQYSEAKGFGYLRINAYSSSAASGVNPETRCSMEVERLGWPIGCIERVQMWWPWNDPAWATLAEPDPKPRVRWVGAIGNPVMFGVGVWLVCVSPFEVFMRMRRRGRARRGACVGCGYPSGGTGVCSECGLVSTREGPKKDAA